MKTIPSDLGKDRRCPHKVLGASTDGKLDMYDPMSRRAKDIASAYAQSPDAQFKHGSRTIAAADVVCWEVYVYGNGGVGREKGVMTPTEDLYNPTDDISLAKSLEEEEEEVLGADGRPIAAVVDALEAALPERKGHTVRSRLWQVFKRCVDVTLIGMGIAAMATSLATPAGWALMTTAIVWGIFSVGFDPKVEKALMTDESFLKCGG